MTNREILDQMMSRGRIAQKEGWQFFDMLDPANLAEMRGKWKGSELASGHPMDGMLAASGWYGKYFCDRENVYPLLFEGRGGELYAANPALLPLRLAERLPRLLIKGLFPLMAPLIRTTQSSARLRTMKCRNKLTAVMIYDRQPVLDIFARVDENTLLGISDFKWEHEAGYFFVLEKVADAGRVAAGEH